MSKVVVHKSPEETETIERFIKAMKESPNGLIDNQRPYWHTWALREAFKAGIAYEMQRNYIAYEEGGGCKMAFTKFGNSTVISPVEPKEIIAEETCDCSLITEKKEVTEDTK